MSDAKKDTHIEDQASLIPIANQEVTIRASNLVRRGLESLRAREEMPSPYVNEDTVSTFNKDECMEAGRMAHEQRLGQVESTSSSNRKELLSQVVSEMRIQTYRDVAREKLPASATKINKPHQKNLRLHIGPTESVEPVERDSPTTTSDLSTMLNEAYRLTLRQMLLDVANGNLSASAVKISPPPDVSVDSSQSTPTGEQEIPLNGAEVLYLASLPEQLATQLSTNEAVMLVRDDPANWTAELKRKMKPFADEELLDL